MALAHWRWQTVASYYILLTAGSGWLRYAVCCLMQL